MDIEKQDAICDLYPSLFGGRRLYMACEDGWLDLIDHLCACMQGYYLNNQTLNPSLSHPVITDIKEKYGRLSVSYHGGDDVTDGMVWFAEHLSAHTCEITGQPGSLRQNGGWYKTLSDEIAEELGYVSAD